MSPLATRKEKMAPEIHYSNNNGGGSFFEHFIAGALIVLGAIVIGLVVGILIALWNLGVVAFTVIMLSTVAFCWLTHTVVLIGRKLNWWDF